MNRKRDIMQLYREANGLSYMLLFDNSVTRYHAKDYLHKKPHLETYLPCETFSIDEPSTKYMKKMNEYVGELVVESSYNTQDELEKVNFILILIANPSFKLDSYMENIIGELCENKYAMQSIPMIKLSYMGIKEKDNHLFE